MSYAEYDDEGNMIDARGMITVPREVVSQYISHVRQSGLPQVGFRGECYLFLCAGVRDTCMAGAIHVGIEDSV